MEAHSEDKQEKNNFNENKKTPEQQEENKQVVKSSNEEKFTWHPGDIEVFNSVDDIPGFQPFSLKNKNQMDNKEDGK